MLLSTCHGLVIALSLGSAYASPDSFAENKRQAASAGPKEGGQDANNPRAAFFREIVGSSQYSNYTRSPTPAGVPLKVGIVGAGAAGLYSAILLDSLGIDYDIFEASGRIGGRIYTYRFDQAAWDNANPESPAYYDYYVSTSRPCPSPLLTVDLGRGSDEIPADELHGSRCWLRELELDPIYQRAGTFEESSHPDPLHLRSTKYLQKGQRRPCPRPGSYKSSQVQCSAPVCKRDGRRKV